MSQKLTIVYKNKSIRVINVSNEFFETEHILNRKTGKREPLTVQQKAKSLAESFGRDPLRITLVRDDKTLMDQYNKFNAPDFVRGEKKHQKKPHKKAVK
jgi:hypothetical protein